ncbi:MAG: leucyl aminopeptidase [Chloroflexota bacterium]|nr:leucyl aminopeptidase [Chloroflexota bacterium]
MKIKLTTGKIEEQESAAIIISLFTGVKELAGTAGNVGRALNGALQALLAGGDFRGKRNEVAVLYPGAALPARRVILVGLGKREKFSLDVIRQAAGTAAQKARALGATQLHTVVHGAGAGGIEPQPAAEAVVEGTLLGLYRFHELKTELKDVRPAVEELTLVESDHSQAAALRAGIHAGESIAAGAILARDLINRPANIATPTHIVAVAQQLAAESGLTCRIMEKNEMQERGMYSLLSVNQGGGEPARMVILEHNAVQENLPTVVLVGKGITFDSGGISIKSGKEMWRMKGDMGGAAAVIGALQVTAALELPLHVVGLTPLTENMPDAFASKPGDVVRSLKGLTIEIINTDAEGRMILADALTYSGEFHPDAVLDIATLTGARMIALGVHAAAVMGDEKLTARLQTAGQHTYERVWPLPLFEEYGEQLKSNIADIKHLGGRPAGSITAGYFLSKFPPEDAPWAHIDIAGLALVDKERPYIPKGGTGFGVRLLVELLRHWE